MGFSELVLLGAIAGFTIYLGLPAGRLGGVDERVRVALPMFSVGILAFIFMDVTKHGQEIVDTTLGGFKDHRTSLLHVVGLFSLLAAGFTAGTAGIPTIQRSLRGRRPSNPPIAGGSTATAFTARELAAHADDTRRAALQTGMTIAAAIGLHNFAEGLAIGVSAKAGAIGLATVLIVGFGLHNATEGFGIVGPLRGVRPSWGWPGTGGAARRRTNPAWHDRRLPGPLRSARAVLLRPRRRRDPVRRRRDLDRRAPLRASHARPVPTGGGLHRRRRDRPDRLLRRRVMHIHALFVNAS
jgi:ZIP family zinc transporter